MAAQQSIVMKRDLLPRSSDRLGQRLQLHTCGASESQSEAFGLASAPAFTIHLHVSETRFIGVSHLLLSLHETIKSTVE